MKQPLVIGNWKMNGNLADNSVWAEAFKSHFEARPITGVDVVVCPPYPYLYSMRQMLPMGVRLGAQDVSSECTGAYTGEVSISMLKELQCSHVILGHSELRQHRQDTNATIARKFKLVALAGLTPILCVGETQAERDRGLKHSVVAQQIQAVIDECGAQALRQTVIAYEPVWAIGSGVCAEINDILTTHKLIKAQLTLNDLNPDDVALLYGGSLKPDNSEEIFSLPYVDGGLVGGASLNAQQFLDICRSATTSSLMERSSGVSATITESALQ